MNLIATCEATPNMALVKYWGKRDEKLILPTGSSVSVTYNEILKTRTSVMFSDEFTQDEAWLQNKKLEGKDLQEVIKQLDLVRAKANVKTKAKMVSLNGFPTAAGLASSASGLAALTVASSKALGLNLSTKDLSIISRQGSGSSCRSVIGGWVVWHKGVKPDGSDSFAEQIADENHWPEFRSLVAVVDHGKKKISSRAGMKQTAETSLLYSARVANWEKTTNDCIKAVNEKNLSEMLQLVMHDSLNLHAVMLDTLPPIMYLNEISKQIIYQTLEFNQSIGSIEAGYTFDAGPNANIFTIEKHVPALKKMLMETEGVLKVLEVKAGSGPKIITDEKKHLIDPKTSEVRKHFFDEKKNDIIVN